MAYYFLRHPDRPLLVAFSPRAASQTLRHWLNRTVREPLEDFQQVQRWQVPPSEAAALTDHHRVLFVRDPLRRLVSFYAQFVVLDPDVWCHADEAKRFGLAGKTFRQLLFVLDHLRRHDQRFQHHLEPQSLRTGGITFDELWTVERLPDAIGSLNRRFGFSAALESRNVRSIRPDLREPVADRPPSWLREHGVPAWEHFYDEETRALAGRAFAADVKLHRRAAAAESRDSLPSVSARC